MRAIEKIECYRTSDGLVHATEQEAHEHECRLQQMHDDLREFWDYRGFSGMTRFDAAAICFVHVAELARIVERARA